MQNFTKYFNYKNADVLVSFRETNDIAEKPKKIEILVQKHPINVPVETKTEKSDDICAQLKSTTQSSTESLPKNIFECEFLIRQNNGKNYKVVIQSSHLVHMHPVLNINPLLIKKIIDQQPYSLLICRGMYGEYIDIEYMYNVCDSDIKFKFNIPLKIDLTDIEKELILMNIRYHQQNTQIEALRSEIDGLREYCQQNVLPIHSLKKLYKPQSSNCSCVSCIICPSFCKENPH